MPLNTFPFLKNNTRLVKHKNILYKVKVVYDLHVSSALPNGCQCDKLTAHLEIENAFRAVLYLSERVDKLKPILTDHFIISATKIRWALPEKYGFSQNGRILQACPYLFHLNVKLRDDVQEDNRKSDVTTEADTGEVTEGSRDKSLLQTCRRNKNKNAVLVEKVIAESASIPRFSRTADGKLLRTVPDEQSNNDLSTNDNCYVRPTEHNFVQSQDSTKRKLSSRQSPITNKSIKNSSSDNKSPVKIVKTRSESREKDSTGSLSIGSPALSKYKLRNRKLKPSPSHSASPYRLRTKQRPVNYKDDREHSQSPQRKSIKNSEVELKDSTTRIIRYDRRHKSLPEMFGSNTERSLRSCSKRKHEDELHTGKRKRLRSRSNTKSGSDTDASSEVNGSKWKQSAHLEHRRKSKRHLEVEGKGRQSSDIAPGHSDRPSASVAREGLRPRHKLYTDLASPQVVQKPLAAGGRLTSPRVSTVLPVKRTTSDLQSAPPGSRPRQLRSSQNQLDLTPASLHGSRQGQHTLSEDSRRLERMAGNRPTQTYRDILLGQTRDRHMVEQSERAETQKLRQLYEPVRRSPRNLTQLPSTKKRRSSGLWGRFMDDVVTPVKMFMGRK